MTEIFSSDIYWFFPLEGQDITLVYIFVFLIGMAAYLVYQKILRYIKYKKKWMLFLSEREKEISRFEKNDWYERLYGVWEIYFEYKNRIPPTPFIKGGADKKKSKLLSQNILQLMQKNYLNMYNNSPETLEDRKNLLQSIKNIL
ncbi:hypothetical protein MK079_02605 [Candidatus Gracilibacteria bacterium]|nr:hypothetical protein [Candidatus Gracilibacteria bacterium]